MTLLHLLVQGGFTHLIVCHLDHRLRGRASSEDARFVARLAGQLGLACEIGRMDVRGRMAERGESLETAARNARHEFFAHCAVKQRCRRLLLAHHADDQAETVLWNLLRGSHGLKGMREQQAIRVPSGVVLQVLRPLVGLRHAALVDWLRACGHRWREDASNLEPVAVRNRLRHEVLPLLGEVSGRDVVAALVRGAADSAERAERDQAALERARLLDPQGRLYLPALRALPLDLQRAALRNFLLAARIVAVDRALLERALILLDPAQPAAVNLPGGSRLRRSAGRLWLDG